MHRTFQNLYLRHLAKASATVTALTLAVAQLIAPPHANAQVAGSIDFTTSLQAIQGFGFSDAFGEANTLQRLSAANQTTILNLLFSTQVGAGFSIYRVGINTDSYIEPTSPGTPSATPTYTFDGSDGGQVCLAGPRLAENMISTVPYQHQYMYQYSLGIDAVLLVGSMLALARFHQRALHYILALVILVGAFYSCVNYGLAPFSKSSPAAYWNTSTPQDKEINTLVARVPVDAVVSAWYIVLPHLDRRPQAYLWPNPFSTQYWGNGLNQGVRLPVASKVTYLVLPNVTAALGTSAAIWARIQDYYYVEDVAGS